MSRSRVVLDLLAARQAARQTGELQAKSQPISMRNRPPLQQSSSPKVQSQPFQRQVLSTAAPIVKSSGAKSVLERLQARKERLAAASSSDKASIPGNHERWTAIRQRHATRTTGGASSEKPAARQPLNRTRQVLPPVVERLNKPARQVLTAASVKTGPSFSCVAPTVVAPFDRSLLPLTPDAPRAARFRDVKCEPVPWAIPVKSSKVPLRGILKRNGQDRVTVKAERKVGFAKELASVKVVDRWIGEPWAKRMEFVHPDPSRSASPLDGTLLMGMLDFNARWEYEHVLGQPQEQMPRGLSLWQFNNQLGFGYSKQKSTTGPGLPKDIGLDLWTEDL
ncbi:MAG: hypothetical protein Q9180_003224 [Flavoplaca navasiana]